MCLYRKISVIYRDIPFRNSQFYFIDPPDRMKIAGFQ